MEYDNMTELYPISDTKHRIHKNSICLKCADVKTCELASEMHDTLKDYSIECTGFNPKDVEIYDNEGKTFDRYTVITNDAVYGMSLHPRSPQGLNQYYGEAKRVDQECRTRLGKKVDFKDLPKEVQQAIIEIMKHE